MLDKTSSSPLKTIFILFILLIPIWGGVYFFLNEEIRNWPTSVLAIWEDIHTPSTSSALWNSETQEKKDIDKEWPSDIQKDLVREKIENIKKRLALKWIIIQGDTYYRNQQLALALESYEEFYKEHPSDPLILEKLWNTYMQMYEYNNAQKYYSKISEPNIDIKIRRTNAYIYAWDLSTPEWRLAVREKINTLKLPDDLYFYYQNSIKCIDDFISCKFAFKDYLEKNKAPNESSAWEISQGWEKMLGIVKALENYENFQLQEEYLEDAYLIWALYTDRLYPLAIELWNILLTQKTDYKPILKIIAQSYYELWKFQTAKDLLTSYYEADSDDPSVAYLLWVINGKLEELVLSNIYLKKAMKIWYQPRINVIRQLIHNYYLLENDDLMLKEFQSLVLEKNLEKEDLWLAIYHHIIHDELGLAQEWSQKWQEIFPESSDFHAYESWVLREKWDVDWALAVLQKWLGVNKESPFIILNIWYTLIEKNNSARAKKYFEDTIELAPESQFAQQARNELKKIEAAKKDIASPTISDPS